MIARLWGLALLLATVVADWLAVVVVLTMTRDTLVVAHVDDCSQGRGGMCSGTWTDAGGRLKSGEILGVGHSRIGQDTRVHLGALGPIAQGAWGMVAGVVTLAAVADLALIVVAWWVWRHRDAVR
ncbi:hypothetical protein ABT299_34610 [Spirillospora sp. NPDC000708]